MIKSVVRFSALFLSLLLFSFNSYADKFRPLLTERTYSFIGKPLYIRIFKNEKILELYAKKDNEYVLVNQFNICNYSGGLGPKKIAKDQKSPEGFYRTSKNALNPNSSYHLSFGLNYPNAYDRAHRYGGSLLMIHGGCLSKGCYAMGDRNIEQVYYMISQAFAHGQSYIDVHIFPFRMTEENMKIYSKSQYIDFWKELQPAYHYFEKFHQIPIMKVIHGRYILTSSQQGLLIR